MIDEHKLLRENVRGSQAQAIIENELLIDAFETLEDSYIAAWRATRIDDTIGREKLFLAINVVGKVRDHLNSIIATGKLAQAQLDELAKTAERKKRFGIV